MYIADKDLDFEITTQPCRVLAHEWMLREMARNLLHNAIRLTPPGSALRVTLGVQQGMAELVVADSGPGISDELHQRLFQPFAAGHAHSGSGLGLTITREMVRALGGSIQLNNRYEQGLCVGLDACVRLPLQA
jgi:two-component system, OmpR family, sensor histidine kinase TctE